MTEAQMLDFSSPKLYHFVVVYNEKDDSFSIDWESTQYDLNGGVYQDGTWRRYEEREYPIADLLEQRLKTAQMPPRRPIDSNVVRLGRRSPETSQKAAQRVLPRTGTKRRYIYELIAQTPRGLCDHEIEAITNYPHQSASSIRNGLMNDGWIKDSGLRRKTPQGNDAIAWVVAE